ncbi:macrophage mannose receptor 1-like protein [Aphelenchoides avenae]|nr:macrophage mannose receptor 1-like protein [Aphelenchus avenae]
MSFRLVPSTDSSDTKLPETRPAKHVVYFGQVRRCMDRMGVRVVLVILLLLVLFILLVGIFSAQGTGLQCDEGWAINGRKCFKVIVRNFSKDDPLTFEAARKICALELEGDLASIHSVDENALVHDLLRNSTRWESPEDFSIHAWIGLHAVDGKWVWTDGTSVDFTSWSPAGDHPYKNPSCAMVVAVPTRSTWVVRSGRFEIPQACICQKRLSASN